MAISPLTWRNVNAPDLGQASRDIRQAGRDIGGAFVDLGNVVDAGVDKYTEAETNEFIADLQAAPDDATRQQMIAEAQNAFLNRDKIQETRDQLFTSDRSRITAGYEDARAAHTAALRPGQLELQGLNIEDTEQGIEFAQNAEERAKSNHTLDQTKGWFDFEQAKRDAARDAVLEGREDKAYTDRLVADRYVADSFGRLNPSMSGIDRYNEIQTSLRLADTNGVKLSPEQRARMEGELAQSLTLLNPDDLQLPITRQDAATVPHTGSQRPQSYEDELKTWNTAGGASSSQIKSLETRVLKDIQAKFPEIRDTATLQRLVGEVTNKIPAFVDSARRAGVRTRIQTEIDETTIKIQAAKDSFTKELEEAPNMNGILTAVKKYMQDPDLNPQFGNITPQAIAKDLSHLSDTVREAYPNDPVMQARAMRTIVDRSVGSEGWFFDSADDVYAKYNNGSVDWESITPQQIQDIVRDIVK